MILLVLILLAAVGFLVLAVVAIARVRIPLVPALKPGGLEEARDPEYFALQEQCFLENGFESAGDFFWHHGLNTTAMRLFRERNGEAYGWACEEAAAGADEAVRFVSVLTEFTDGDLLGTTSSARSGLLIPSWFLREVVPPDTMALLRRHGERKNAAVAAGKVIARVEPAALLDTVRRNERRLGEYQLHTGRYKLVGEELRYNARGLAWTILRALGLTLAGIFRRSRPR